MKTRGNEGLGRLTGGDPLLAIRDIQRLRTLTGQNLENCLCLCLCGLLVGLPDKIVLAVHANPPAHCRLVRFDSHIAIIDDAECRSLTAPSAEARLVTHTAPETGAQSETDQHV